MKLLLAGATAAYLRAARDGLDRPPWTILEEPAGATDGQDTASTIASLIAQERPDVIYSPVIVGAGLRVAAARKLLGAGAPPWLTSVGGFDLMPEYQEDDLADNVRSALRTADGLLPFAACDADRARQLGFGGRVFPIGPPVFEVDISRAPRAPSPSRARRTIVVDGRHDRLDRGLVALAGLRSISDSLAGYRLIVMNAGPDVVIAATVLGSDISLPVTFATAEASTPGAVLAAQSAAACSIRLSLNQQIDWWDVAALIGGALPILGSGSAVAAWADANFKVEQVDPEDPNEIGAAVKSAIDGQSVNWQARARNAATARRAFGSTRTATLFGYAVRACALGA